MPYKCNVCGRLYKENSEELRDVMLRGNCVCGKRFLMYIRKGQQEKPVKFEPTPEEKIMEETPSPYLPQPQAEAAKPEPAAETAEEKPSPYLPQPQAEAAKPEPAYEPDELEDVEAEVIEKPGKGEGVLDWLERKLISIRRGQEPMYLSIETIKILEEGKYHIDVGSLMGGKPIIVKDKQGVYYIDVPHAMRKK